jgi:TorA maturation chaperone TorD
VGRGRLARIAYQLMNPTEQSAILAARSLVYSFVSALFSPPDSEKFEMLHTLELQNGVLASSRYLDEKPGLEGKSLEAAARKVFVTLRKTAKQLQNEYALLFGHTLSKDTAPYEMEHLKNKEVFALTQGLADIQGFYKAFGVEVDAGERADHIAIESEFLSFLLLKESLAVENQQPDNEKVSRQAQKDFWKDHYGWWTPKFASRMQQHQADGFYRFVADFFADFLESEKRFLES